MKKEVYERVVARIEAAPRLCNLMQSYQKHPGRNEPLRCGLGHIAAEYIAQHPSSGFELDGTVESLVARWGASYFEFNDDLPAEIRKWAGLSQDDTAMLLEENDKDGKGRKRRVLRVLEQIYTENQEPT